MREVADDSCHVEEEDLVPVSQLQQRARLTSRPMAIAGSTRGSVGGEVGDGAPFTVDADDCVDTSI